MITLEDLIKAKEENQKTIEENKAIIEEKQKFNFELENENRVFEKLIVLEKSKEENNENI